MCLALCGSHLRDHRPCCWRGCRADDGIGRCYRHSIIVGGVAGGVDGAGRRSRVVCRARPEEGRAFVGVCKAGFVALVQQLDVLVEVSQMLVHVELQLLRQDDLLVSKPISSGIVFPDLASHVLLARIDVLAAVRLDVFLNFAISVLDELDALVVLSVLVGDLVLEETDFFGQILHAVEPVIEDYGRVERLDGRHLPDEVDGEIVSRHRVNEGSAAPCSEANAEAM